MSTFKKAERKQTKLKIALTGPSGSGKTFSALLIAAGIGKRIAVVDTENKSASLYAGMEKGPLAGIAFDLLEIDPPYTIPRYTEAIETAEKEGYDVLIIDSISHAWTGEGGLLSKKEALDQRAGSNSYTNWAAITPEHEKFKAKILQADIHIICTMRSKQDYVLEQNEKGKSVPKKVGLAPIQRDGMEYEFTTVLDLAMDHHAKVSKDRTSLFDGEIFKPAKETGKKIMAWLMGAKPVEKPPAPPAASQDKATEPPTAAESFPKEPAGPVTDDQLAKISQYAEELRKLGKDEGLIFSEIHRKAKEKGREIAELVEMDFDQADHVAIHLGAWIEHIKAIKSKKNGKAA